MGVEEDIQERFNCVKCGHSECQTKELSMSGTGLGKMFDVETNYFTFVSCSHCGYTEVFNSDILKGHRGQMGNIMDLFFG